VLAVRWYLRFGLSYRDVEELLAERGIEVDHVSVHRWVSGGRGPGQRLQAGRLALIAAAAQECHHHRGSTGRQYVGVDNRRQGEHPKRATAVPQRSHGSV
jgi:hypothetical protein